MQTRLLSDIYTSDPSWTSYVRFRCENLVRVSRPIYESLLTEGRDETNIINHLKVLADMYIDALYKGNLSLKTEVFVIESLFNFTKDLPEELRVLLKRKFDPLLIEGTRKEFREGRIFQTKKYGLLNYEPELLGCAQELIDSLKEFNGIQVVAVMSRGLIDGALVSMAIEKPLILCRFSKYRTDDRETHFFPSEISKLHPELPVLLVDAHIDTGYTISQVANDIKKRGFHQIFAMAGYIEPNFNLSDFHLKYGFCSISGVPTGALFAFQPIQSTFEKTSQPKSKFLVCLMGKPGSGKTLVYKILRRIDGISSYKWGKFVRNLVSQRYGRLSFDSIQSLTNEEIEKDSLLTARYFLLVSKFLSDDSQVAVIDGIKTMEQCRYLARMTGREIVTVLVYREEPERRAAIIARSDFDDAFDKERLEMLSQIGSVNESSETDVLIDTTGSSESQSPYISLSFLRGIENLLNILNYDTTSILTAIDSIKKEGYELRIN
jgi:dephospho-CoA kinase/adenine/guanine phosphoribosyltransferase-like PRPP-binding protein